MKEKKQSTEATATANLDIIAIMKAPVNPEGKHYSNWDDEKEPIIAQGFETIIALSETNKDLAVNPFAIALGKHWHDRETWGKVREMVAIEAAANGMEQSEFEQNLLRKSYEGLASIQAAITRLNYCFNYMKPREATHSKEKMKTIRIDGILYTISEKNFKNIKAATPKDKLKDVLLQVAKPMDQADIEVF